MRFVFRLLIAVLVVISCSSCMKAASVGWYTHYGVSRDELYKAESVDKIKRALKSRNVYWRIYSARVLGETGPKAVGAIPELTEALNDEYPQVRWEASKSLGLIGPGEDPDYSIANIGKLLSDKNGRVVGVSLYSLSVLGVKNLSIIDDMMAHMFHQNSGVRRQAMVSVCNTNKYPESYLEKLKKVSELDENDGNKKIATELIMKISNTNKCSYKPLIIPAFK